MSIHHVTSLMRGPRLALGFAYHPQRSRRTLCGAVSMTRVASQGPTVAIGRSETSRKFTRKFVPCTGTSAQAITLASPVGAPQTPQKCAVPNPSNPYEAWIHPEAQHMTMPFLDGSLDMGRLPRSFHGSSRLFLTMACSPIHIKCIVNDRSDLG
jgi:hypothetical protein